MVLYEHPLNERIRNYLKLEQLFAQAKQCSPHAIPHQYFVFFSSFFAIIDTLERNDIRGELIKDLEKLEQHLVIWSKSPEIDSSALSGTLKEVVALVCQLKSTSPKWSTLKEDKLLSTIKQRFAIQGGSSIFDLPQLQFWLHQKTELIAADITQWLTSFKHIEQAIKLVLKFIRQRSQFETVNTETGFFQDSGEGLVLLRMKLDEKMNCYPTVSGNKFRYSIRFMYPCPTAGKRYLSEPTQFELSRC